MEIHVPSGSETLSAFLPDGIAVAAAFLVRRIVTRASLFIVSQGLTADESWGRTVRIGGLGRFREFVDDALARAAPAPRVVVLPEGGKVLPLVGVSA